MLAYWQEVLVAIVQQPAQAMAGLPLLPAADQRMLGAAWQGTVQRYPQCGFPHLFARQVARCPEAVALVCDEQQVTYGALNRRANQLAHSVQSVGVGPEVVVGLWVPRSLDLIVGLLGILKAGGVFAPLDPQEPRERLAFLLAETRMPVLVTWQSLLPRVPQTYRGQVVCLDRDGDLLCRQRATNPQVDLTGEHLAYVLSTSGSTGQPKGVQITHRALVAYCWSIIEAYQLRAEDHVLQFSSFTFDTSLEQLLPSMLVGARLVLRGPDLWSPAQLLAQSAQEALTVMDLPTAYWQQFVQELPDAAGALAAQQRLVTVGGERLLGAAQQRWRQSPLGEVALLNTYGPTETTITATVYDTADDTEGSDVWESVPIGRPLLNRSVAIVDRAGQPVPVGVAGELWIGGEMLARGYLHRPDLTADCFVPDPFSGQPGARCYRTGDVVRVRPDGMVQYVGRRDAQVKLRGFRVELGEIESVLTAHPGVRACAVVAHPMPAGDLTMAAYVVLVQPEEAREDWWDGLRAFLQERLPEYMVPAHGFLLAALPVTASGKVDRHALLTQRPEEGKQHSHRRQQPCDRIELQLLRIWERVLEREPISLTDTFFHQGGHSLAALRLHAQIQHEFQRQFPLGLVLQYPTICGCAQILRQEIGYVRGSALVPLQPHGSHTPFFCVHPGGGSVFCYLDLVQHLGMNYPVYGLQVPEVEEGQAIASVEQLAALYIAAVHTIQPQGPYLLGGWSAGGIIAYEMACQLRHQGHDVALLCLFDSRVPASQRMQEHEHASALTAFLAAWGFEEQKVLSLTEGEQLRAAYDVFKQEQMLPEGLDMAYVQSFIHLQSAIDKAVEAYMPPPSTQRITLVRVEQEGEQDERVAQDGQEAECDRTYGWSALAKAEIDVWSVPGTHNEMFREPYVHRVAAILQACLDTWGRRQEDVIS